MQQDVKQARFAGVHPDVGGGYAEEESGLAKFPLDWMIREATAHGLQISTAMRNHLVLGRPQAGERTAFVKPDATADAHDSLTRGGARSSGSPNLRNGANGPAARWLAFTFRGRSPA
jgi:hypothetical protein